MYCQFFNLRQSPFSMTPDPAFLFMTSQHREALAGLIYAILARKGFLMLTGEAGTGKTTLLTRVLQFLPAKQILSSVILNPMLTAAEFLEMTLLDFGITEIPNSKAQRLAKLQRMLLEADSQKKICTLVIDEAHKLSPDVLEEVRLLGNFEHSDRKLLQILLLGQSELNELLNQPGLRQFKQRIAARFSIGALSPQEVEQYIQCRWSKAGGSAIPFDPESLTDIAQYSKSIPRVINAICDNALILAFSEGNKRVQPKHVLEACRDLDLIAPQQPVIHTPAPPPLAPVAVASQAEVNHSTPPASNGHSFRSLERYELAPSGSFLERWAVRLKLI